MRTFNIPDSASDFERLRAIYKSLVDEVKEKEAEIENLKGRIADIEHEHSDYDHKRSQKLIKLELLCENLDKRVIDQERELIEAHSRIDELEHDANEMDFTAYCEVAGRDTPPWEAPYPHQAPREGIDSYPNGPYSMPTYET